MRNWVRSWWIVFTLPLGFLGWAAFVYAGFRAKQRQWIGYGVAYLVPVAAFMATMDNSPIEDYALVAMLISWPLSFVHALVIRQEYLDRRDLLDHPSLREAQRAALRRELAGTLARGEPELARAAGIGRPELEGAVDSAGLVDVNHATARELQRLPGVDARTAKQIAHARDELGGFSSAEELGAVLGLPGPLVDAIRDSAPFLPR